MKSQWNHLDEFDGQGAMLAQNQSPWVPLSVTITVSRFERGLSVKTEDRERLLRIL